MNQSQEINQSQETSQEAPAVEIATTEGSTYQTDYVEFKIPDEIIKKMYFDKINEYENKLDRKTYKNIKDFDLKIYENLSHFPVFKQFATIQRNVFWDNYDMFYIHFKLADRVNIIKKALYLMTTLYSVHYKTTTTKKHQKNIINKGIYERKIKKMNEYTNSNGEYEAMEYIRKTIIKHLD